MSDKNLLPLIDGDIFAHECSYAGQMKDDETGEIEILPFHLVITNIDKKVADIQTALDTCLEPIMFLSGDTNFREQVAVTREYKGNRKDDKPFHFYNTRAYLKSRYNTYLSKGCEADDLLCISQMESLERTGIEPEKAETVIVTRDKDLRQCLGYHYGWEVGNQPEYPLTWVTDPGTLTPTFENKILKSGQPSTAIKKLEGTGTKWFYAQLLLGDFTDNIPGVIGFGKSSAYKLLNDLTTEEEMYEAAKGIYQKFYGDEWKTRLYEQAHLVWMIKERNDDGSLKWWVAPEDRPDGQTS